MSYEMIDHFLRNNLDDEDYAEYSAALDSICAPSAPDVVMRDEQKPVAWMNKYSDGNREFHNGKDNAADYAVPVYMHPAPDVVKQLVEALEKITQVDAGSPVKTYQEMEDIAKAALEAAKEAGYDIN